MVKFDFETAKSVISDIVMEGEAIVQSGDLGQSRTGRLMHILGSVVLTILEGIGSSGWDKLHDQAASDLNPPSQPERLSDGDFQDAGLDAGTAFRGKPGDGPTATQGLDNGDGDDGSATGATGDQGTRTNAGATGDGNTAGNVGNATANNNATAAGANTGGVA